MLTVLWMVGMPVKILFTHTSWVVQTGQLVSAEACVDCVTDGSYACGK